MKQPELTNLFSIKSVGSGGIAIIPDAPPGTILTPGFQVVILTALLDFFVNSVAEGEQNRLETFLLDNFPKACELRHEQATAYSVRTDELL